LNHPAQDIEDRKPIWDFMQNFWMDTDPQILLPGVVKVCAASKYTMAELEAIYWNEVRPAVSFNLWMLPAPEWAGFKIDWLVDRILKRHRYGTRLPVKWLHLEANRWWRRLEGEIAELRPAAP
jgi:hypothetical protein